MMEYFYKLLKEQGIASLPTGTTGQSEAPEGVVVKRTN